MNRLLVLGLVAASWLPALPALARDFVQDQAGMFSPGAVASANSRIASFNAQTGKEVVVVTVPSLGGQTLQSAAANAFSQQNVNGVLIFIAKDDRKDIIVPDRAGAAWFTPADDANIRRSMEGQFRNENYDAGLAAGVDGVLSIYRQHLGSLHRSGSGAIVPAGSSAPATGGFHLSMFWWIIIAIVAFFVLRSILRAFSGPRYYGGPGGVPPGGMPPGGGYGPGPGYGYGGGYGGGGGSFWSGLLGGLGGAWLGNEMFNRGGGIAPVDAATQTPADGGGSWGGGGDASGWQSDAGQADMSGASGGDWGGGGFGDTGGGFGGGDMGGGGGDMGGGW